MAGETDTEFWDRVGTDLPKTHIWRCNRVFADGEICHTLKTDLPDLIDGFTCDECWEDNTMLCDCGDPTGDQMHCNSHAVSHGYCNVVSSCNVLCPRKPK